MSIKLTDDDDLAALANTPPSSVLVRVIAVIVAALLSGLFLVFLLSSRGGGLFHRKASVRVYLNDATGLNAGAPVRLNGIIVGKVRAVKLSGEMNPRRIILVELAIENSYLPSIVEDSMAGVTADNLLGDNYINITKGRSVRAIAPGEELPSLVQTNSFNPADLMASLQATLKQVDILLIQIENGDSRLGKFVQGEDFYNKLRTDIAAIQNMVVSFGSSKSQIGKALFGRDLYEQLKAPARDFDKLLSRIQQGQAGGAILVDDRAYQSYLDTVQGIHKSLEELNGGKGAAGKLLKDDDLYKRLQTLATSLDQLIGGINNGGGALGQLLANSQLYDSLNGSARDMQQMMSELRANPQKFLRYKVF